MDWLPWEEESFIKAKVEDKPIFLSIGYSTCHWCHRMERESFSNPSVIETLQRDFVCIHVDRDEFPHIDHMYMGFATLLLGGSGGWPLNLFLTPELKPFYVVTYLPPRNGGGLMGLIELAEYIADMWKGEDRSLAIEQANEVVEIFLENEAYSGGELPAEEDLETVAHGIFERADPVFGGLAGAPKFPLSYQLQFLMSYAKLHQDSRGVYFTERTLDKMVEGGMYDQIGGGFSRYSVDVKWEVPHFEKMLYDNALLATTYFEGYQFFKKKRYLEIAEEILAYVDRELSHPEGGFYAGEDAETEGEEGLFYTWTKEEIGELFTGNELDDVIEAFDITEGGNFEGRNVLLRVHDASKWKKTLFEVREKRKKPMKDRKVLTSWNGLMITAFAKAGQKRRAEKAAAFIEEKLVIGNKLFHCFKNGDVICDGILEDYTFMIQAFLTMFDAAMGDKYLEKAIKWTELVERYFKAPSGLYFSVEKDALPFFRRCDLVDGSEPSGNAVHVENLLRLHKITGDSKYLLSLEEAFKACREKMVESPLSSCYFALALARYLKYNAPHERDIRRFSNST